MSKQLRIWLFVLLSTLLTSTSLLAEGVITLTTSKAVGEEIRLSIEANGSVSITGVRESALTDGSSKYYTLTSQTITILGDVTMLKCSNRYNRCVLTSLDASGCTALKTLDCRDNKLTSLNASGCTSLTTLDCQKNKLTSLNVSGCIALTKLDCSDNRLTSLDVSGCTALTKLDCRENELTRLNVSSCTALTQLYCGHNQLTSLDVSKNTALTELNCSGSYFEKGGLTSLDVSKNTALTTLDCFWNQLTSLDVSKNTALTTLNCGGNQLTSLDVSKNTALTTLNCGGNQLTSLDVSKNTALTTLNCGGNQLTSLNVSGCTALTKLDCKENQLTSLTVQGCTALTTLTCYNNQLTSLDVSDCTSLGKIECYDNRINGEKMTNLVNSLPNRKGMTAGVFTVVQDTQSEKNLCRPSDITIALEKNWNSQWSNNSSYIGFGEGVITMTTSKRDKIHLTIEANGSVSIYGVWESARTDGTGKDYTLTGQTITIRGDVTYLNCYQEGLTSLDVSGCTALTKLTCYGNQLTSLDVSKNTALTMLNCGENRLTSLDVSKNTALTTLNCSKNRLTSLDVSKNTALTKLYCSNNQLTSLDVSKNTALTWLNCEDNQLTSLNVSKNTALTELWCHHNQLTSLDVSKNTALTTLGCSYNQLTSLDLSKKSVLTSLNCNDNKLISLDVSGCTALTTLGCFYNQLTSLNVSDCTALTKLNCERNSLTSLDVSGCIALTELDCHNNQLTSLDASGCTALTKLDCQSNQLTSLDLSGCTALTCLILLNNQLTTLDLMGCTALTELDCRSNQLTSLDVSGCTALTKVECNRNQLISLNVSGCTALTKLTCYGNKLTNLDLSDCTALTQLTCQENQLTSLDLSKNHALATIDCSDNKLPSLDLSNHKALAAVNCSKNLLRKIDLSGCTSLLSLTCYNNQIKEREMTNLVNSLPDLGSKGAGAFKVFYDGSGEGNVCLAAHVATAQAKGWKTQFTRSSDGNAWYDYTGADNPLYAVTSSSTGGGSISFTGADNLNAVPYGTTLTVVASPADGYKLTKLTANGQDILETKRFKVTENTEVKATFALQSYSVTPIKVGEGTFYISGADNLEAVTPGTELTITAEPAEGYELAKLTANDKNILDTKKVTVNEDLIIRVIFSKKTFKVSLEPRGKGTIKAVGADDLNAVPYGTELTIEATPEEGSELASLIAGGINITETKKVTIKRETTIEAVFTTQSFAVKLTKEGEGTISATGADNLDAVDYGTELTIVATPAAGYKLTALTANGQDILATKKVVIKGATEVKATFANNTGVETTVTQQIQLYPNPATDYVIVEGVAPASEVTLHSMTGERLYAGRADSRGVLQIDLTPYADGVYLVCVAGETYRVVVRR